MKKLDFFKVFLAVAFLAAGVWAQTENNVPYLDENGVTKYANNVTVISAANIATIDDLNGWYLVRGNNLKRDKTLIISGETHIILENGSDLTVTGTSRDAGINVSSGNSLNIYAQSIDDNMGKLAATAGYGAGIGGGYQNSVGEIIINGGIITANSTVGAGIGGGEESRNGKIIINGGIVTATSQIGAGIGGGDKGSIGKITINGGTVMATSASTSSAAIGGGRNLTGQATTNVDEITITGGTITANGGAGTVGAGIGGGYKGNVGKITISGGKIDAIGGSIGVGIGGGDYGDVDEIVITGGTVMATGGTGIGVTNGSIGEISISDGMITANGNSRAGIGNTSNVDGNVGKINISGGTVTAIGGGLVGIGIGYYNVGEINISGGTVTAIGSIVGIGGKVEEIIISGGIVTATSTSDIDASDLLAGIGAPYPIDGGVGKIVISNGTVTATSRGFGIGGKVEEIIISGGIVMTTGERRFGIGIQNPSQVGKITISGGAITATSGLISFGIGGNVETFALDGNAVVFASGDGIQLSAGETIKTGGILFIDNNATGEFYGTNVTITDNVEIPNGYTLNIPNGSTLTIPDNIMFTNNGIINVCGKIIGDVAGNVPQLHYFDVWTLKTAATCTTKAAQESICNLCGHEATRDIGEALGHNWNEKTIPATCEVAGSITKDCNRDGCDVADVQTLVKLENCGATQTGKFEKSDSRYGIRFAKNIVSVISDKRLEIVDVILPNDENVSEIKAIIYDNTGNVVYSKAERGKKAVWNLTNSNGRTVANGTYLVIVEAKSYRGKSYWYSAKIGVKK